MGEITAIEKVRNPAWLNSTFPKFFDSAPLFFQCESLLANRGNVYTSVADRLAGALAHRVICRVEYRARVSRRDAT